ncbi:MAG: desulfoferrodoxin family protein [Candidatus Aminicenantaceae bacterium]
MKNRGYRSPSLILFTILIVLFPLGCTRSRNQPAAQDETAVQEAEADQAESTEAVYTRDDPGGYRGKEDSHVPVVAYEKTETGLRVTVSVNHEMNSEKPHFIEWIRLKDGANNLMGEIAFQATDEKAEAVFELTTIPDKLVATQKCNLHGVWQEEIDVT